VSTTKPTKPTPTQTKATVKKTSAMAPKHAAAHAARAAGDETLEAHRRRRELEGVVVSNKMDKTCVVQVIRRYKHPKYKKYVNERQRYKAHDDKNETTIGDKVIIVESRPLSKDKRWRLQSVVEKAVGV
jgi:small subunit ribosomal protein S17